MAIRITMTGLTAPQIVEAVEYLNRYTEKKEEKAKASELFLDTVQFVRPITASTEIGYIIQNICKNNKTIIGIMHREI